MSIHKIHEDPITPQTNDNRMRLTCVLKENSLTELVSYEIWKETPQFETIMRTNDSIWKIKDLSSLKCHKELKDTCFS